MTWSPEAWLAGLAGQPDGLLDYAGRLATTADHRGQLRASLGWLRKAHGVRAGEADRYLMALRSLGAMQDLERGRHGQPSLYQLTIRPTHH